MQVADFKPTPTTVSSDQDLINQKDYVVNHLLKHINSLATEVKVEYLRQKWIKNPDGTTRQSIEEQARLMCLKLQNSDRFDATVSSLKQRQSDLHAEIAKKLALLEEMDMNS